MTRRSRVRSGDKGSLSRVLFVLFGRLRYDKAGSVLARGGCMRM